MVLILIVIGVPLWFGALSLLILVRRNRNIRQRPGNVPIRVRAAGKNRWMPAHGVWMHDVFAFRGSPAAWKEGLLWVKEASARPASPEERKKLHRLGDAPVIATFAGRDGDGLKGGGSPGAPRDTAWPVRRPGRNRRSAEHTTADVSA